MTKHTLIPIAREKPGCNGLLKLALVLLGGLLASTAQGQVEADPNKEYLVTPEAGPWMIKAAVFVGPEAPPLAHKMIIEIRRGYQLPAYVFNFGQQERRKRDEELQRMHRLYPETKVPLRTTRIEDQCAVLIGGYKDSDEARRALEKIKKLPPPSDPRLLPVLFQEKEVKNGGPDGMAELQVARANPFAMSFVIRNPTVPQEQPTGPKTDPFLKQLNADEPYSLLKCKKPWTLLVAVFHGLTTIQAKEQTTSVFDSIWPREHGKLLAASGHNAQKLAEALRKLGFDAYVLHTRQASFVTIGAYDSKDDPQMQQVQRTLASNLQFGPNLQLLPQPSPIPVPRP
jgi:hypothetical protein